MSYPYGFNTITGCQTRGSANSNARLDEARVAALRDRYATGGVRVADLATQYGLSWSATWRALTRRTWKHVP